MRLLFIYIFAVLATITSLTNCGIHQDVTIHADRSALVSISFSDDSASYFRSAVIKDYSSTKDDVHFTILNIDSLGNYLSTVFNKNYFKFRYSGDSLEISDGYGEAFVPWITKACCGHTLSLTFDQPIKGIKTKNKFVKREKKKNEVYIIKTRKKFKKQRTFVTIYLGE